MLCDTIKEIIKTKGLKQKTVACEAGFTEQQFSDMLNGRKTCTAEHVAPIAKALNVTPNELFKM